MQLKKMLKGAVLTAAIATVLAFPRTAKAEEITGTYAQAGIGEVYLYENGMEVSGVTGPELLVGVGKVNKGAKKITVASWDTYDTNGNDYVHVNLLKKVSISKDNYIVIRSGMNRPACVVKKSRGKKVIKAKFDPVTGKIQAGSGNSASEAVLKDIDGKNYESFSIWTSPSDYSYEEGETTLDSLDFCRISGGKIYICDRGTYVGEQTQSANESYTFENQQVKVYDLGSMPSKTIKLTIPARAKGPKIGADYVNGTVKFPKNSEYRISTSSNVQKPVNDKYTECPDGVKTIEDIVKTEKTVIGDNTKFDIEVRTVATDKKVASKWSHLLVEVPKSLSSSELVAGKVQNKKPIQQTDKEDTAGGKGVFEAQVKEGTTKVLDISYVKKGKIADTTQQNNAVQIKNSGKFTYEVVIGKDDKEAPSNVKATKIAPNKTVVLTKDADDGSTIWIRKAGDKKTQTWAGIYAALGIIDYNFVVPAKDK